jgi:nitrogen fixation protein FixH
MLDSLITLPLGILFIVVIFLLTRRVLGWGVFAIAGLLLILVMAIYGVYAVLKWPGLDVFALHLALYTLTIFIVALISQQRSVAAKNTATAAKWHWGPIAIIGFFIAVILINTLFVMMAQQGTDTTLARWMLPAPSTAKEVHSGFPGTVFHDFREKEDEFNQYQHLRHEQSQRGWRVRPGWQENAVAGTAATLLLEVLDKEGNALQVDTISGKLLYPANSRYDVSVELHRQKTEYYQAQVTLPKPGRWELVLTLRRGEERHEVIAHTDVLQAQSQP